MQRWEFMLLDAKDRDLRLLDGVTGGRCEIVAQSTLGGSGSLTLDEKGQGIDWMSHRVRATFIVETSKGRTDWIVGTWLFASPKVLHSDSGPVTYETGLLTKMNVPAEDTVEQAFSLAVGAPVIPAVVGLLQSTGETRIAVTPSDAVRTAEYTVEAGTSKLKIINELLGSVGYWSLWCDGSGQFRIEPYTDPASRPVARKFEHGLKSIHLPEWTREQNLTDVPNRIVLRTHGDADTPALVGVAVNDDPDSPFSFVNRGGRWIGPEAETVEAESQDVIDQLAARKLADAMHPVSRITISHMPVPLNPNDLVKFIPEDGATRLATVQRMAVNFSPFTDVDAEWREA